MTTPNYSPLAAWRDKTGLTVAGLAYRCCPRNPAEAARLEAAIEKLEAGSLAPTHRDLHPLWRIHPHKGTGSLFEAMENWRRWRTEEKNRKEVLHGSH